MMNGSLNEIIYLLSFIIFYQYPIIIKEVSITISSPWNAIAKAIWRSPSSLTKHSAKLSYESSKSINHKQIVTASYMFVKTAIETNKLPMLIRTTGLCRFRVYLFGVTLAMR